MACAAGPSAAGPAWFLAPSIGPRRDVRVGHTPGHSAYLVASAGERLVVWGDTVHVPEIQVTRPELTMIFDTDPVAAAAMRRRMFDMVVTDRL